jgi:hypothetical protein
MNDRDELLFLSAGVGATVLPTIATLHGFHGALLMITISLFGLVLFGSAPGLLLSDSLFDNQGDLATHYHEAIVLPIGIVAFLIMGVACGVMGYR